MSSEDQRDDGASYLEERGISLHVTSNKDNPPAAPPEIPAFLLPKVPKAADEGGAPPRE